MAGERKNFPPQKVTKPEGSNRKNLKLAMEAWNLPRVDTKDPAAIEERIEMYLQWCAENDIAPSVAGCSQWLGVWVNLLQHYYQGKLGTPEHQRVAAKFYNVLQTVWAMDMHEGNINPVSGIFMGKVFYGYKDTQEIVVNTNNAQDRLSVSDLIAESKRLPGANTTSSDKQPPTIDADFRVVDKPEEVVVDEPAVVRAAEREKRKQDRIANHRPKSEYLKEYYQAHKEEYLARNKKSKERQKEKKAAEQAQKGEQKRRRRKSQEEQDGK